ncbi:MAG: type IV secretion system DNA-binding domain-containing protein [Steroidobacteraceae bacterium]
MYKFPSGNIHGGLVPAVSSRLCPRAGVSVRCGAQQTSDVFNTDVSGRCVIGFQSIAQVSGTYGQCRDSDDRRELRQDVILRCSSSANGGAARFASSLIGEREVVREQVTKSRGGGPIFANDHRSVSTSLQHVTESAVLASEIEQLPDLQGYLKFASQPEWKRVRLTTAR